ncbi:hypothetical protein DESC_500060 [Desulfosarcina cetonica]|nr:hypothetical protein DESC_500060 [Desulfosarcina cetonica]
MDIKTSLLSCPHSSLNLSGLTDHCQGFAARGNQHSQHLVFMARPYAPNNSLTVGD